MYLVVTATDQEMEPITRQLSTLTGWLPLVSGVGCLETAVTLTRFLATRREPCEPISGIINCGVAGALVGAGPGLLDLCLADQETQADSGLQTEEGIVALDTLSLPPHFPLAGPLLDQARAILASQGLPTWTGPMVSVLAVSGTASRGEWLRTSFGALCENMEGAAVARVAREFGLPCLELRAISNMVETRDLSKWQLPQAIERAAMAMTRLLPELVAMP